MCFFFQLPLHQVGELALEVAAGACRQEGYAVPAPFYTKIVEKENAQDVSFVFVSYAIKLIELNSNYTLQNQKLSSF